MRVVVTNNTGQTVKAPWPLGANIEDGQSTEFQDMADNGVPLIMMLGFAMTAQKLPGLAVQFFRGDPEEEYMAVRVGPVPQLRKVES